MWGKSWRSINKAWGGFLKIWKKIWKDRSISFHIHFSMLGKSKAFIFTQKRTHAFYHTFTEPFLSCEKILWELYSWTRKWSNFRKVTAFLYLLLYLHLHFLSSKSDSSLFQYPYIFLKFRSSNGNKQHNTFGNSTSWKKLVTRDSLLPLISVSGLQADKLSLNFKTENRNIWFNHLLKIGLGYKSFRLV